MKKFLLVLGIILVLILGGLTYYMKVHTKKASPLERTTLEDGDLKIAVSYCRPYKKGRVIFGGLEPYGEVWRTGANEATIFETTKDLIFGEQTLKAGKYSLWTIPGEQTWTIIFNSETGQWGVDFNGLANRDPAKDALTIDVPSVLQNKEFEQFTISIEKSSEEMEMILMWDKTLVSAPFMMK